jgi:two-component system, NarL family, sensor histidine kinase UhpB
MKPKLNIALSGVTGEPEFNTFRGSGPSALAEKKSEGTLEAAGAELSLEEARCNLHKLQVAQAELVQQNEELRHAQLELEETKSRYQDLFESAPVGYLALDVNGVITEANLTAAALLGVTKRSLVSESFSQFIADEDRELFQRHLRTVAEYGPLEYELRMVFSGGGTALWVRLLCAVSRGGGYRVTLTDASELRRHRDHLRTLVEERTEELQGRNAQLEAEIAERKRAEEALSQSERRYRAVVEDQTELITRQRPDGRLTFANRAFCRFFGKMEHEVVGSNWRPQALAEDSATVEKRTGFLSPANPVVVMEYRVVSGSEEVRWMQFVKRGFFDDTGQLQETQTVGRDITERKLAEQMLLSYADEVQDLYNNAPCGYHSLDEKGFFLRINDTELGWLGYQRHEIIGVKRFADLVTPEGAELFRANFPRFLEQGRICGLEYQMVRKDGSRFPVIVNAEILRNDDGSYLMSRGMVFDNTERREAEEQRRRSDERFRGIFENAPFGIFQTTLDGRIISVNPTLARMFGFPNPQQMAEEAAAGAAGLFVDPGQREAILKLAQSRPGYLQAEVEYRRRDGVGFFANVYLRAVQDGGSAFLEGFVEDICSRKEAEGALQKSELQFRQMAETIDEVFWLTAPAAEGLLYLSPAYERIWGRPCAEAYGKSRVWMDAILPEYLPQVRRQLAELDRGNATRMEYRIRRPDGSLRWISDHGYPLCDASGAVTLVTGVASDITTRKLAEEALKKYARRLILLEEDLRKRIAVELHDDIGQVLTALGLNLAHLGNHLPAGPDGELRAVLEDSRLLTKEISRTVRNLMVELRPTQLEEYGLAAALRSHAEQFAQRTGIAVAVHCDPGLPRLAAKKEIALFRITQEALNNVSKHAVATRVTVAQRRSGTSVLLSVEDDGRGFLPRADAQRPAGTGWGLAIMRERAELVGGSFTLESLPGQGTTVTVEIKGRG